MNIRTKLIGSRINDAAVIGTVGTLDRVRTVGGHWDPSKILNEELEIKAFSLEEVSLRSAMSLAGKAGDFIVGIYLLFPGSNSGHALLCLQPETAFELVDMAMNNESGTTRELREMGKSVLGEIGNIVGLFFLDAVGDYAGACMTSSPAVIMDLSDVIVNSLMADVLTENENSFVIRVIFATHEKQIEARFLTLSGAETVLKETK